VKFHQRLKSVKSNYDTHQMFPIEFAKWQHDIWLRFALSGISKESFNPGLDPNADPDHHQN